MRESTALDQMICFQLYAASRAMTSLYRPYLDPHGLTYPQYLVLRVLWHDGPTTVRDLGRTLRLDSGTLSPLLKRLETQGHIRRERGTHDERTVVIHPTDTGLALQEAVGDLTRQLVCATGLTLDELTQLHHLLSRARGRATPPKGEQ
ncbi:MarR family transcriptional regulator [Actinoplanes hulinensis]|uniref:MarR family transcriptional regulator n=1 Tax=Actinoplanes hulinensis TaxID=1144547 RepID=A0ABS7B454_9ACTN|nr:MarR family transcriptional regulator [Actinoplanes hulinensis]MBW6435768.1 MarR family transcriptional regulator [Actinoplanes hulinensis]